MKLDIEIISDIVCPWCYIGKRRLDRALSSFDQRVPVSITWKPFQLNPDLPAEGVDRKSYFEKKFGAVQAQQIIENLTAVGKEEGINFHFEKIERTPNTEAAHRLVWLARKENRQDEIVEGLFKSYFCDGKDIGKAETLMAIGAACGIPQVTLQRFFAGSDGKLEVQNEFQEALSKDITMVPHFIMNKDYWISGADTVETFENAFKVAAQASA